MAYTKHPSNPASQPTLLQQPGASTKERWRSQLWMDEAKQGCADCYSRRLELGMRWRSKKLTEARMKFTRILFARGGNPSLRSERVLPRLLKGGFYVCYRFTKLEPICTYFSCLKSLCSKLNQRGREREAFQSGSHRDFKAPCGRRKKSEASFCLFSSPLALTSGVNLFRSCVHGTHTERVVLRFELSSFPLEGMSFLHLHSKEVFCCWCCQ